MPGLLPGKTTDPPPSCDVETTVELMTVRLADLGDAMLVLGRGRCRAGVAENDRDENCNFCLAILSLFDHLVGGGEQRTRNSEHAAAFEGEFVAKGGLNTMSESDIA